MLDRRDYVTAIPQLASQLKTVEKKTEKVTERVDKTYGVHITAINGNRLNNEVPYTRLVATVTRSGEDITDLLIDRDFTWTRFSGDAEKDAEWNADADHSGKKSLVIDQDDIPVQAIFRCTVSFDDISFSEDITCMDSAISDDNIDAVNGYYNIVPTYTGTVTDDNTTITSEIVAPITVVTYVKTEDPEVISDKTYYTVVGAVVTTPNVNDIYAYYELDDEGVYFRTADATIDISKTYYTLTATEVSEPDTSDIDTYYEEKDFIPTPCVFSYDGSDWYYLGHKVDDITTYGITTTADLEIGDTISVDVQWVDGLLTLSEAITTDTDENSLTIQVSGATVLVREVLKPHKWSIFDNEDEVVTVNGTDAFSGVKATNVKVTTSLQIGELILEDLNGGIAVRRII